MMKIFSIFTGAGGLDLGFHGGFDFLGQHYPSLGFYTEVAVDHDLSSCETVDLNLNPFQVLHTDILANKTHAHNVDVLLGGFPCVTFSGVGKRTGISDTKNGILYEAFVDYVESLQPKVFVAENVKGILSANKGEAIEIITRRFKETGYRVQVHLVNFADYGVPQLRQRVLFIGVRDDIKGEFKLPTPTTPRHITSGEAFEGIPDDCPNHDFIKHTQSTIDKLTAIPEGGNFKDLPPHLAVNCMMSNMYRRLDRNTPAYTVTASGGGGTWSYHYEEPRALTNRERARLQGFPDNFEFVGNNAEVRRQIGNAVPPVGIYPIAKAIKKLIEINA